MSRRRNGTTRAAAALGLNPYGWGNGKARKKPMEVRTPVGHIEKLILHPYYTGKSGGNQDGR